MARDAVLLRNSENAIEDEFESYAAIMPGQLIEVQAGGGVVPHETAAGPAQTLFAGLPFDPEKDLENAYGANERVRAYHLPPGVVVNAQIATGNNVDETTFLVSNGDGALRAYNDGVDEPAAIVARSMENFNNTSGGPFRARVEVM